MRRFVFGGDILKTNYKRLKAACYMTTCCMSLAGNISPLLFLTFHELYGISYTLLGFLVLINFCTQLGIDLVFSFFSKKFNIPMTVKVTPLFTLVGFLVYAAAPILFPNNVYIGILIGTVIFSVSSGLSEVLTSPTIAAIPSDNPDREMSKLHSVYAWGVVAFVLVGTLFLHFKGGESWQVLPVMFSIVPLLASFLYVGCEIPTLPADSDVDKKSASGISSNIKSGLLFFIFLIFLGGCAECVMAQWCSSYIEQVFELPKLWGDLLGVAVFSATLGLGRSLYGKIGKNIAPVITAGFIGSAVCYLVAALSGNAIVGLIACALTGFCVSMLWPGSLIWMSDNIAACGVTAYALMASGGDLGASIGPQLVGIITDTVSVMPRAIELAAKLGISPEQLAMKSGMLVSALFPILGIVLSLIIIKRKKK